MRSGTPNFCGQRLREAREARGLTAASLADMIGISRQAVSLYELGQASPSPDHSMRIGETLNLPLMFFLSDEKYEDEAPIFWRSMATATRSARVSVRRRYDWLRKIVAFLSSYVSFPELNLPSPLADVLEPTQIDALTIEDAARAARQHFSIGNGAIDNMAWLFENNGIFVGFSDFGAKTLDSFSQVCRDGHAYCILNHERGTGVRYRLDLAHELGHLVLHRNLPGKYIFDPVRDSKMESQANAFASEFLMPSREFARNFPGASIDGLKALKRTWKVSMQAILIHASDLDLITKEETTRLWRSLTSRGYRRREPLDDVILPETPELVPSAFIAILQSGAATREHILERLPFGAKEIETLCGLPRGTLSPVDPIDDDVVELNSVRKMRPLAHRTINGGEVVSFKRHDKS